MNKTITDDPSFKSFIMAGFECTYALDKKKKRMDMLASTKHDEYCRMDYKLAKKVGIHTVREGLSWSMIDKGWGTYDFSRFEKIMQIGQEEEIQQIWDLNHFDYPEYLDPFDKEFIDQFAAYTQKAVQLIRKYNEGTLFIVPWNEISFTAWMGADQGNWAPYLKGSNNGFRLKKQLVAAVIAAINAIREIDKDVRFIHVDPLMHRQAKEPASQKARDTADEFNDIIRYEAWDMIAGKTYPELGGRPEYLDILGINYYFHNQMWILPAKDPRLDTEDKLIEWDDPGRLPFGKMLEDVYHRYGRPMIVSETGSHGDLRSRWWTRVLREIDDAIEDGLPVYGICAYPTVDKPVDIDWIFSNSGLWDFDSDDPHMKRIPHEKTLEIIRKYIKEHNHVGQKINSKDAHVPSKSKQLVTELLYYTR